MASFITGSLWCFLRPRFPTLNSLVPWAEVQVRDYAARKSTREKALKKKRAIKLKKAAQSVQAEKKTKGVKMRTEDIKKTVIEDLSPPPTNIDVYFAKYYQPKEYSISEAIEFHKENLHPTVLNSEGSLVNVFIELNMTGEKSTRVISPWRGVIVYPNVFQIGFKKRLLVLCMEDYKKKAVEYGADVAGGSPLIKQIKKGDFDVSTFDLIIAQLALHEEISLIKSHLKQLFPKPANGTLVVDFLSAIEKFKYGIEYRVHMSQSDRFFGYIETPIGYIDTKPQKLEENFEALVENIYRKRPKRGGDFITHVYCLAPPSRERFKIEFKKYEEKLKQQNSSETNESNKKKVSAAGA